MLFPEDGLVYDYALDDGGISKFDADDDEVDDTSSGSEVQFSSSKFETSLGVDIVYISPEKARKTILSQLLNSQFFIILSVFFINRCKFISLQTPVYRIISESLRLCEWQKFAKSKSNITHHSGNVLCHKWSYYWLI